MFPSPLASILIPKKDFQFLCFIYVLTLELSGISQRKCYLESLAWSTISCLWLERATGRWDLKDAAVLSQVLYVLCHVYIGKAIPLDAKECVLLVTVRTKYVIMEGDV